MVHSTNNVFLLHQLEELAGKLGIEIRYENVASEDSSGIGGLCRLKGKYVLILHLPASVEEKVRIIAGALRQFPIGDIYIKPVLRELLEKGEG